MNIPKQETDLAAKGEWLANEVIKLIPHIWGIEHRVSIMDYTVVPPEEVTFGTCDVWGYDEADVLTLIDAKSGQKRDYREQMAVYALALMEKRDENICRVEILYCDSEPPSRDTYAFSRDEAELIVFDVVARVNAGVEAPRENEHCKFCAKKPTCPVWVIPASQALDVVTNGTFDLESLKADPVRLGEFLSKWYKAEKLVEAAHLKDAAKTMLAVNPKSVPGWKVQPNTRTSYTEDEIEDIILLLPELGMDRARSFLNVDRKAFEQAWKTHSNKPIPVVPSEHFTYQKLIQKK